MNASFNLVLSMFLLVNGQPDELSLVSRELPNPVHHCEILLHRENKEVESKDFELVNKDGLLYFKSLTDKYKCITIRVHTDTIISYHDQLPPLGKLYVSIPRDIIRSKELFISFDFTHEERQINKDYLMKIQVF